MSYLKTINKNKMAAKKDAQRNTPQHTGPIDVLIVSPEDGTPKPLYVRLKHDHALSEAGKAFLRCVKETKMPDVDGRSWAFSYDGNGKWHQIDNHGTVRRPPNG